MDKEEAREFEIDFIAATYMLADRMTYDEARKLAVEEWKEMQAGCAQGDA